MNRARRFVLELVLVRSGFTVLALVGFPRLKLQLKFLKLLLRLIKFLVLLPLRDGRLRGHRFRDGRRRRLFRRRRRKFKLNSVIGAGCVFLNANVRLLRVCFRHPRLRWLKLRDVRLPPLVALRDGDFARREGGVDVHLEKELRARVLFARGGDIRLDCLHRNPRDRGVGCNTCLALHDRVVDGVQQVVPRVRSRRALRDRVIHARLVFNRLRHGGRGGGRRSGFGKLLAIGIERINERGLDHVPIVAVLGRHRRGRRSGARRVETPVQRPWQVAAPGLVRHHREPHARHGDAKHRGLGGWFERGGNRVRDDGPWDKDYLG